MNLTGASVYDWNLASDPIYAKFFGRENVNHICKYLKSRGYPVTASGIKPWMFQVFEKTNRTGFDPEQGNRLEDISVHSMNIEAIDYIISELELKDEATKVHRLDLQFPGRGTPNAPVLNSFKYSGLEYNNHFPWDE
jgi:hypothetical protein